MREHPVSGSAQTLCDANTKRSNAQRGTLFDAKFAWRNAALRQTIAIAARTLRAANEAAKAHRTKGRNAASMWERRDNLDQIRKRDMQ